MGALATFTRAAAIALGLLWAIGWGLLSVAAGALLALAYGEAPRQTHGRHR